MKTRILLLCGLGLIFAAGIALAIPSTRYPLFGLLNLQQLTNGRPISYWIASLQDDDPALRRQAAKSLGDAKISPHDEEACAEVITALVGAFADKDGFVRKCAATSFLIYPKETTLPEGARVENLTAALD